jgi:hypothetical protein
MFNAGAYQDQFTHKILNEKRNGYFVDIGSCGPIDYNNTYFFESIGWKGICVEMNQLYAQSYGSRTCKFINQNALNINYKNVFEEENFPKTIDYLSLDIDELSLDALLILPHDDYIFNVITIEHDFYIHGDKYKKKQRDFLLSKKYHLIGSNVKIPRGKNGRKEENVGFEDWWIHPSLGKNHYYFDNLFPEDIISDI